MLYFWQEYFADYAPILPSLFSLNHAPTNARPLFSSTPNIWDPRALELAVQGITAVLLSLKKKPVIRYEKMSSMAKKLGTEVQVWSNYYSLRRIYNPFGDSTAYIRKLRYSIFG